MAKIGIFKTFEETARKLQNILQKLTFEENFSKEYIDVEDPANNAIIAYNSTDRKWEDKAVYELTDVVNITTSDYTATLADEVIVVDNGNTALTITLPTAVGNVGKKFEIKVLGLGVVTVDPNGSETIDDQTTICLSQYDGMQIVSNDAEWVIV